MMKHYSDEPHLNLGTGHEISIASLAEMIAKTIDYRGRFVYDTSKPDGAPRKLMDVSRLTALGWTAKTEMVDGLRQAYAWYVENVAGETPGH
jgi:GDP-L-fucose synthase